MDEDEALRYAANILRTLSANVPKPDVHIATNTSEALRLAARRLDQFREEN